jgi:hypothetical protein
MNILQQLRQHLETEEAKKFNTKQRAAFWYGAICTLAQTNHVEDAQLLCTLLNVEFPSEAGK